MKSWKRLVGSTLAQWRGSRGQRPAAPPPDSPTVLDWYVKSAPSPRNAVEIFKGEWSSQLPGALADLPAGGCALFEDQRITWAAEQWGGLAGRRVLELGPLEAGHTYMMEQLGAAEIVAVEANTRAYLKCLVVKELLGLKRARFLCGDFVEHLRTDTSRYDACVASGVLYHMRNPVELIAMLSERSDRLFLWTHYYDAAVFGPATEGSARFGPGFASEYRGFRHTLYRHEYRAALNLKSFCGGNNAFAHWMPRADILGCLRHFGYGDIRITLEQPSHPNGPSFCIAAGRLGNGAAPPLP